jgi:hypothetical protein
MSLTRETIHTVAGTVADRSWRRAIAGSGNSESWASQGPKRWLAAMTGGRPDGRVTA